MGGAQLFLAHAVKIAIIVALIGLVVRRRYGSCWSITAYLAFALVTNAIFSFWPETHTYQRALARQAVFDAFKLAIALELAHRVFAAFPGALSRWRWGAGAVLVVTTMALAAAPRALDQHVLWEWQPRIMAGALWLLCGISVLVVYHRLPIDRWHHHVLLGYTAYLVVFNVILRLLGTWGWSASPALGVLDSAAYLALMAWFAVEAWHPAGALDEVPVAVRGGLRWQTS